MIPGVLVRAKGCPAIEAADAIRNACMEFCTETYCLTTGHVVVVSGTQPWPSQFETQVLDIVEARIGGKEILVTYANDPAVQELGPGEYALTFSDPSYAQLTPAPSADAPVTIELLLVIAPGPESTGVHDLLWLRHSEAIRDGALARVLATSDRLWSNPTLSAFHRDRFDKAMRKAKADHSQNRRKVARRLRAKPAPI